MKAENKLFIRSTLINGFIFAALMAGFDFSTGEEFEIKKYIFHFTFFGLSMGFLARYNYKKGIKKTDNENAAPPDQ